MINTVFRLIIFIPAALVFAVLGVLTLESEEYGVRASLTFALMAALPVALIAWTLLDHRKRAGAKDDLNA